MLNNVDIDAYLQEIETWKKSSQMHAKKAVQQYRKAIQNIEDFQFEKKRNEVILDQISDVIIVLDNEYKISLFNKAARILCNISFLDIFGKGIESIPEEKLKEFLLDIDLKKSFNEFINIDEQHFKISVKNVKVGVKNYIIIVLNDITEVMKLQALLENEKLLLEERVSMRTSELKKEIIEKEHIHKELKKLSLTDSLTQLPNRKAFEITLESLMNYKTEADTFDFALFFLDLDGFKTVNDTLGHDVGDKVLIHTSKLMKSIIRKSDFIARLGGDEFVIILKNIRNKSIVTQIAQKLINAIYQGIHIDNNIINVSLSIGILMNPLKSEDFSTILSHADNAMYEVKSRGKNAYLFFNKNMSEKFDKKVNILNMLNHAFDNNEFYFQFQPICNIDGEIVGCELLSRWKHENTMIPPSEFIPILENKGMIIDFTKKMITSIFEELIIQNYTLKISINLSVKQFYDKDLILFLEKKAQKYPSLIHQVNFEITENIFTNNSRLIALKLEKIKALGYKIYIDDFGTGYSSFDYIRKYPIDVLKIDKIFVDDILTDERQYKLLKGMISLALSLDMQVVIEGIETQEQYNYIKAIGMDVQLQGYYFYKPMEKETFFKLIKTASKFRHQMSDF